MEQKNKLYYKIYSCKSGEWKRYKVEKEQEIVPFIEKIFEDDTVYRIIKHNIDHDEGIRTIFNKADLEDFRSEVYHKQLEQDKLLQEYYEFKKRGK